MTPVEAAEMATDIRRLRHGMFPELTADELVEIRRDLEQEWRDEDISWAIAERNGEVGD